MILHSHPVSRGSVHISSTNVDVKQTYDPRYLSHPLDLKIMARQIQFVERRVSTEPFCTLLKPQNLITKNAHGLSELAHPKDIVKDRLYHCFQPAGTCAMLLRESGGVVDCELRVHGTRHLRVVDAIVFPLEPSRNIQATVYAVAERAAADMIRGSSI